MFYSVYMFAKSMVTLKRTFFKLSLVKAFPPMRGSQTYTVLYISV